MEFKVPMAQAAKLLLLVLSLTLIPFVSSSLRPSYLYFLLNILIIVLGYESGILHIFMEHDMEKKKPIITATTPDTRGSSNNGKLQAREGSQGKPVVVEAEQTPAAAEKTTTTARAHNMKKAPSVPSLFFIGNCDEDGDAAMEDVEEEDVFVAAGEISGQELFARAESFIGNFYKQLKMQREESWKKIHGFYHRTF
ncbi:hypothetical protein Taro_023158 [Colocasia esculenta]|uniref:DUF4408 domain-containing protein n=1 Tax=Colocasia esculenta TaxID=4460 RepID=A0A843V5N3_COLES|nr:hypothetical protein [Colocasia esculenta]